MDADDPAIVDHLIQRIALNGTLHAVGSPIYPRPSTHIFVIVTPDNLHV